MRASAIRVFPVRYCFLIYTFITMTTGVPPSPLAAQTPAPAVNPILSPYRNLKKSRQILDTITRWIILEHNYQPMDAGEWTWQSEDLPGVLEARYFYQNLGENAYRTIEIAVTDTPGGKYAFYVMGVPAGNNQQARNPLIAAVLEALQQQVQTIKAAGPRQGYEMFTLSYIQSDRALALLKALGYTTIEYTEQAGETIFERVFTPYQSGEWKLPAIIKVIDAPKTSLMDVSPTAAQQQRAGSLPELGGTYLHHVTSGEQTQRLLMVYDLDNPEPMEKLLNLLRGKIDRPARQIVIEAMVIELNTNKLEELGFSWRYIDNDRYDASFEEGAGGAIQPFSFRFSKEGFGFGKGFDLFDARFEALLDKGAAQILSRPSVLVLDGRQARIQVTQQIPVVTSTSTTAATTASAQYFTVGIVLNLRPRITADGSEITMQVETIVSSVGSTINVQTTRDIFIAPIIENRQVQTFVRVADNTPFIIGGLISNEQKKRTIGIPYLSDIPILGWLFKRRTTDIINKEVIVVLTPHVAPTEVKNFSYVIPKDSDFFDGFNQQLFRNAYRIRDDDIFDLKFVYDSEIFNTVVAQTREYAADRIRSDMSEPVLALLDGKIPGEEVFVRRMLWEIIHKTGFYQHIQLNQIIVFENDPDALDGSGYRTAFLNQLLALRDADNHDNIILTFKAQDRGTPDHPFALPKADIVFEDLPAEGFLARLMRSNPRLPDGRQEAWSIMLPLANPPGVRGASALDLLQGVLVMKRILALNTTFPLTIQEFRVGRQIILPTESDLEKRYHVIDRDIAQYFYEAIQYYPEFEQAFNIGTRAIREEIQ